MMQNSQKRIRLRVSGRVQGVGFRWFVLAQARRLGLHGWVRNNPDGTVELEAEGPANHVSTLREHVQRGPPAARVDQILELAATTDPLPASFSMLH